MKSSYNNFQQVLKYLGYYFSSTSGSGHGIHSPFVFDFVTKVLDDRKHYPEYHRIEDIRRSLRSDRTIINIEDYGAGSAINPGRSRSIRSIAGNAAKSKKFGQLLFRMVRKYQPPNIIELGTSLGITSAYLATGNPAARVYTLEGAPEIADKAREVFHRLNLTNIQLVRGNFDDTLEPLIQTMNSVDLAFIDGNHQQEPTLRYFTQLHSKAHNDSVFIFDDIHWSKGMESVWKNILKHPSVRCSIDLYFLGIVLFREEFKEVQHFVIRF